MASKGGRGYRSENPSYAVEWKFELNRQVNDSVATIRLRDEIMAYFGRCADEWGVSIEDAGMICNYGRERWESWKRIAA